MNAHANKTFCQCNPIVTAGLFIESQRTAYGENLCYTLTLNKTVKTQCNGQIIYSGVGQSCVVPFKITGYRRAYRTRAGFGSPVGLK